MKHPPMRKDAKGRFVAPCAECMRRYRRDRGRMQVFGLGTLIVLAVALIWTCVANGWL